MNHARAVDAKTIRIPGTEIVFAPSPPGAVPAMTARQAWARFSRGERHKAIPAGTTVQLGRLTVPIGPYCGRECDGHPVRDGIAYTALDQLAYGYSWLAFPHRHLKDKNWIFLDATTGTMIIGTVSREPGSRASPPAGDHLSSEVSSESAARRLAAGGRVTLCNQHDPRSGRKIRRSDLQLVVEVDGTVSAARDTKYWPGVVLARELRPGGRQSVGA